jgi:hypothetical protein
MFQMKVVSLNKAYTSDHSGLQRAVKYIYMKIGKTRFQFSVKQR